ncbi:alpha/beta hydrolase [Noviherbaspirillum saxi]|nr:alpha/beta fold hydrolase [Noviherbaspirillum saxi]
MKRTADIVRKVCWIVGSLYALVGIATPSLANGARPSWLQECRLPGFKDPTLCGHHSVFENRSEKGRRIELKVVVVPAKSPNPAPDPVFLITGGPGQAATDLARFANRSPLGSQRDIVLIDQRGTRGSNPLICDLPDSDRNLQSYFEDVFEVSTFSRCRDALADRADVRYYTTIQAIQDLDEVREALQYRQVNLLGWSYGTRVALQYAQAYPERVRTLILNGTVPVNFRNPLPHARSAQQSIDAIFAACAQDTACNKAFPNLNQKFQQVLARLNQAAAGTIVRHPVSGEPENVLITKPTFVEALRMSSYHYDQIPLIPKLINDAYQGNFALLAEIIMKRNRSRAKFPWGMLLAVTCSEDVSRIADDEVESATANTALGDYRIRRQMKVCSVWPKTTLPDSYTHTVALPVPALILSGIQDPVTPTEWGEEVRKILPNSLHIVVPGGHIVGGGCLTSVQQAFLEAQTVDQLDISCTRSVKLLDFAVLD